MNMSDRAKLAKNMLVTVRRRFDDVTTRMMNAFMRKSKIINVEMKATNTVSQAVRPIATSARGAAADSQGNASNGDLVTFAGFSVVMSVISSYLCGNASTGALYSYNALDAASDLNDSDVVLAAVPFAALVAVSESNASAGTLVTVIYCYSNACMLLLLQ